MLEFWQNEKKVKVNAIYNKGKVGQTVIFGKRVNWGDDSDHTKYPLSKYACPSIFTIVEKQEGENGYYILKDVKNDFIKLKLNEYSCGTLYDAQEWLIWNEMYKNTICSHKQRKIEELENKIKFLEDIIIKQGERIVKKEQAKNWDF